MQNSRIVCGLTLLGLLAGGCSSSKPFIAVGNTAAPPSAAATPVPQPVATEDLGTVDHVPGVNPKPRPFIAAPNVPMIAARPSTLLLEHADSDSPVPLSEFAKQPVYHLAEFKLSADLSAEDLQKRLGPPAQLVDNDDPWLVYRLWFNRELWLHFTGPDKDHLEAADMVRGAEDGYVRERVFGE
jgi:hypothetical protein